MGDAVSPNRPQIPKAEMCGLRPCGIVEGTVVCGGDRRARVKATRYRMATAQVIGDCGRACSRRRHLSPETRPDHADAPGTSAVGRGLRQGMRSSSLRRRAGMTVGVAKDPAPWMKAHVDRLAELLAENHGLWIPRQVLRAELARYLTDCSSLFAVSRFEARCYVTEEMMRQSAAELARNYRRRMRTDPA